MPVIRIENGPLAGKVYALGAEAITIGRNEHATILLEDSGVSRDHAEIFRLGDLCFVKDLDSRNGTFVRGEAVMEELLQDGDRVQIGDTFLVFLDGPAQAAPDLLLALRSVASAFERLSGSGLGTAEVLDRLEADGHEPGLVEALRAMHRRGGGER